MPSHQMASPLKTNIGPNVSFGSLLRKVRGSHAPVPGPTVAGPGGASDAQNAPSAPAEAPGTSDAPAAEGAAAVSGASTSRSMALPRIRIPSLTGNVSFKRKRSVVVGLDIQPGYVAAARAHVNGSLVIDGGASIALDADTVREGEVLNQEALTGALRELFATSGLDRHVRIGMANQRTVMRMLDVPPLSDQKDLATAVRFQAEDQMPMPISNAAIDFRPLGIVDTPEGARQRVLLVAAQQDSVMRLLAAVKAAGLHPEGIDLSAFALIRSLYRRPGEEGEAPSGRVLHLNVGGLTNMVISEGLTCHFTRVLSRGLEAIASEVAERRAVPIGRARELLRAAGLGMYGSDAGRGAASSGIAMLGGSSDGAQEVEALAVQMQEERAREQAPEEAPVQEAGADAQQGPGGPGADGMTDVGGAYAPSPEDSPPAVEVPGQPHLTAIDGGAGLSEADAPWPGAAEPQFAGPQGDPSTPESADAGPVVELAGSGAHDPYADVAEVAPQEAAPEAPQAYEQAPSQAGPGGAFEDVPQTEYAADPGAVPAAPDSGTYAPEPQVADTPEQRGEVSDHEGAVSGDVVELPAAAVVSEPAPAPAPPPPPAED
ncbi:MAG: pilus assembly protein PilM, partial [Solirubrobacteraceae bacterium]